MLAAERLNLNLDFNLDFKLADLNSLEEPAEDLWMSWKSMELVGQISLNGI